MLTNLTKYYFNTKHGITGTLADDPIFSDSVAGNEFAKLAIYCKELELKNEENKSNRSSEKAKRPILPLIAFVSIYDQKLLDEVEKLKKGYFVNFDYDKLTITLGKNEKTNEIRINANFVANSFEVRHKPGDIKSIESEPIAEIREEPKRATRRAVSQKK